MRQRNLTTTHRCRRCKMKLAKGTYVQARIVERSATLVRLDGSKEHWTETIVTWLCDPCWEDLDDRSHA